VSIPGACPEDAQRNAPSPIPDPDPEDKEKIVANASLQLEPESQTKPKRKSPDYKAWLDRVFTPAYPEHRRVQDKTAIAALRSMKPDQQQLDAILGRLEKWKHSPEWIKENGKFVPGMGKFLTEPKYKRDPNSSNGAGKAAPPRFRRCGNALRLRRTIRERRGLAKACAVARPRRRAVSARRHPAR
jgi:hypothetical protein